MSRSDPRPLLSLAMLACLAGCSSIPAGQAAPANLAGGPEQALPFTLAVGPLRIEQAPDEEAKEYRPEEVLDAGDMTDELARWVQAAGVFQDTRAVKGSSTRELLDRAWDERDDLLLQLRLGRFRSNFDGHNGWWIPNILNWAFWMVPAWWVATEEYSLTFTAQVDLRSVDSNRVLHTGELDVSVMGTFDEFDRGWQFFGFIYPNNDADNWRMIVRALLPAAVSELGQALVGELRGPLFERLERRQTRAQMRKTLGLIVGVGRYPDAVQLPPLPYAASDARGVASALLDPEKGPGLADRQVSTLIGSDATLENLRERIAEIAARARPGDQTLFYFAGYGLRGPDGEARIVLNGAAGAVEVELSQLGELLASVPGEKLVILDCGFDGKGRSVAREGATPTNPLADALVLAEALGGAALLAAQPAGELQAPEHLAGGLFSHHLIAGLQGAADQDENGSLTVTELHDYAGQRTVAEAAYFGADQAPVLAGNTKVTLPITGAHARAQE